MTHTEMHFKGPCPVRDQCHEYAERYECLGIWGGRNRRPKRYKDEPEMATQVVVKLQDARPKSA